MSINQTAGEATGDATAGHVPRPGVVDGAASLRAGERAVRRLQQLERAEAVTIVDLVKFEEANLTGFLGYTSLLRYLVYEAGRSNQDALRLARLVRHCHRFPVTLAALASGDVAVPYIEVLAAAAAGLADRYAADEAELLNLVEGARRFTFERAVQNWRHRAEYLAGKADPSRAFDNRGLTIQRSFDGSGKGHFNLDAIATELIEQALETPPDSASSFAPIRSLRQRRADALLEMAAHTLSCGGDRSTNDSAANDSAANDSAANDSSDTHSAVTHPVAMVDVVIDLNSLEGPGPGPVAEIRAELASGTPISKALIDQLLCDASYRRLLMDRPSVVLDYGTATRAISLALRRAIERRDHHCQFRGCDRAARWCDVHHLKPVPQGGTTDERNLALVCRHHHTLIYQAGWHLDRDPTTGSLTTTSR